MVAHRLNDWMMSPSVRYCPPQTKHMERYGVGYGLQIIPWLKPPTRCPNSELWLPGPLLPSFEMKVATVSELGTMGLGDLDITGKPPQGPFTRVAYRATATYPSLMEP